jgi:kynurenine formamidase
LFRTGYGQYYPDAKKYLGTARKRSGLPFHVAFPGIDPATAEWLVTQRNIKARGLTRPALTTASQRILKHIRFCLANIRFENVANLDKLPGKGAVCDSITHED